MGGSNSEKYLEEKSFFKKMPETSVPVSLRDAFLEDPFFRTGWDEMNSECREMRSFAEGNNTLATMDRSWPLLPKQWMLPQLFQDFHLPEMKDSLMLGLQEEKDKMEVERGSTPIQVDHVRSSAERKTEEVSSREKKSQDITNEGRADNFEGPGEMQRRRRSLSKAGRSRDTSRAKETITSAINAKENKESKTSGTRSSSRGREMVVERNEERRERG